jgi:tryptophan synthase alpha subunit
MAQIADGVVVGSTIVNTIEKAGSDKAADDVSSCVKALAEAL